VDLADDSGSLTLRFFNFYPSQLKQLSVGQRIRAIGEARAGLFGLELAHPRYRVVQPGTPLPDTLTPVYPSAAGISQAMLRSAVLGALARLPVDETVPAPIIRDLDLPPLAAALKTLHQPRRRCRSRRWPSDSIRRGDGSSSMRCSRSSCLLRRARAARALQAARRSRSMRARTR
jgi:ATP-dependent DNA helicase RecG